MSKNGIGLISMEIINTIINYFKNGITSRVEGWIERQIGEEKSKTANHNEKVGPGNNNNNIETTTKIMLKTLTRSAE